MSWDVSMSFFISIVFGDIVQIISSDDNCSLHFSWNNNALQDLTTNGDVAGEGTFLIDIIALDGLFGSFEVQTYVFVVSDSRAGFLCQ